MRTPTHTVRAIALCAMFTAGSTSLASAQPTPFEDHVLGRVGYGHNGWTLERLRKLGLRDYIEEQLDPKSIPDPVINRAFQEKEFDALRMSLPNLRATFKAAAGSARKPGEAHNQLKRAHLLRMISSRRQVQALMTEFWFNHFNVGKLSGNQNLFVIHYLERTIRNRVFGKFEDLILAVAKSPAMLTYLDNRVNFKKGFKRGGKTYDINENYARELMELHTFGIDDQGGVYKQKDIIALARALTGWTVAGATDPDGFQFLASGHDTGAKTIVGLNLSGGTGTSGGMNEGVRAIRYLARHGRTRSFLCRKLVTFLVGPGHPDLVKRARERWKASGGNLKAVTRLILNSPELRQARDTKVKRPTLFIASAVRATRTNLGTGADRVKQLKRIVDFTGATGLPLLEVPPPTGWTDANGTFVSAGTMLERINRVQAIFGSRNAVKARDLGKSTAGATADAAGSLILGKGALSTKTRNALIQYWNSSGDSISERGRIVRALVLSGRAFSRY